MYQRWKDQLKLRELNKGKNEQILRMPDSVKWTNNFEPLETKIKSLQWPEIFVDEQKSNFRRTKLHNMEEQQIRAAMKDNPMMSNMQSGFCSEESDVSLGLSM
ncbi:hypothetical protein Ciccas_008703 [Cichlidogyrus casuarinus]|uniref:Uncharacterized protein n=1 Tax=Cichlidogyrus casuarinus TaxID=1844966 RepID=A0ABD2Q1V3_9PLAT